MVVEGREGVSDCLHWWEMGLRPLGTAVESCAVQ